MAGGEGTLSTVPVTNLISTFGRIGLLSFGGPAGQIALMHRILVDEKQWIEEKRFLHALNFCMLLPGPEAMQLATYCGWLLRGVGGGLIAGSLFVLPGMLVLLGLSALYALHGDVPLVSGLLFGLKAAVLAIVVQALARVARRTLHGWQAMAIAIAAFVLLAAFAMPFPLVILLAALAGFFLRHDLAPIAGEEGARAATMPPRPLRHVAIVAGAAMLFWGLPLALLMVLLGTHHVFTQEALFFSKAAIVTFGGAYAVLAYVGQQAVEAYQWLRPDEMVTGLGLAETTPGPLILVLVVVGFLGAFRDPGMLDPLAAGLAGGLITVWVTFIPCFIWIVLGAPFIEALRTNRALSAMLAGITAAVVGVIANLSLWFAIHVLFAQTARAEWGLVSLSLPVPGTLDPIAMAIAGICGLLLWRGSGLATVLGAASASGMAFALLGG